MAKKGYDVMLLDFSRECLKEAEVRIRNARVKNKVKMIVEGSITDMPEFSDESFDAVVCLGAMSHLVKEKDRCSAANELVRVTRKTAPIFVSVINLYGVFRTVLQRIQHEFLDPSHKEMFSLGIHRGAWHETDPDYQGFPDAYFFRPPELKQLFENLGIETLTMATCEGLSSHMIEETNGIHSDSRKWKFWVDLMLRTCTDSAILGLGEHFLYVGRKPA